MSRIRSVDTKPELIFRSLLHRAGYRFRLHNKALPGSPDLVLKKYETVIFVNGCFWHNHAACRDGKIPKSNPEWWQAKFERNKARDLRVRRLLRKQGWHVLTVWECQIRRAPDKVLNRVCRFLSQQASDDSTASNGRSPRKKRHDGKSTKVAKSTLDVLSQRTPPIAREVGKIYED